MPEAGEALAERATAFPGLGTADGHCRGHTRNERDTGWDIGDLDAHRHALRQPYPGVDWIDVGQALGAWRGVRDADATGHRLDPPHNRIAIAHQHRFGAVADADMGHLGFLEITVDPIAAGIDHRDVVRARVNIVAYPHQKIGDIAVHGAAHLRPFEVDVGLCNLLLGGVEGRLRLDGVADIE